MKIDEILQGNEGTTLEFKENIKSEDKIISTLIAFSNTSGGRVIIGVQDKTRHIVGVEDPHKVTEALSNKIHDMIEPRILPNIEVISYRNTHLISIEIYPSALRPHFRRSKGKEKSTYIRIGSTTRLADQDLLGVVERSLISKSFDEELCYETSYEDIDFTAALQLFEPHRKLQQSDLLSLGIVAKKGKELVPTVAGILLFGKNRLHHFPYAWIKVGVFDGIETDKILDTQKITSLFPQAIDEALNYIKRNIRVGLKIEDARHHELWEIPKIALREAVINAIVHTDYSLRGNSMTIAVFDDRIEIENSALLPWGLTFEDLKAGVSKLRNPIMARVFNELGLIEQWGSGIKRMTNACLEAGLEAPYFKETGPRIRVTFYKKKVSLPIMDDLDQFILGLLTFCGPLSTHQITSCVGISRRSVINRLSGMVDKGQIIELSQGPNDPKKKYSLRETTGKLQKKSLIREIRWDNSLHPHESLFVRIELGQKHLDFVFARSIIDDYFFDGGGTFASEDDVLELLKEIFVSDLIFGDVLLTALANEKVQEAFENRQIAKYHIQPKDFLERNYSKFLRMLE